MHWRHRQCVCDRSRLQVQFPQLEVHVSNNPEINLAINSEIVT